MVRVSIAGLIHIQKMMDATRAAGYRPLICSPCRSWDKQAELLQRKIYSYLDPPFWVARPDTREHQAGLAVDIVYQSYQLLDKKQEDTPVQQ